MNSNSMKVTYKILLMGFEKYNFSEEQLQAVESELSQADHDRMACKTCDGSNCTTMINYACSNPEWHQVEKIGKCDEKCYKVQWRGYYALSHKACKGSGNPGFAVFGCPGPELRKMALLKQMQSNKYEEPVWAGAKQ